MTADDLRQARATLLAIAPLILCLPLDAMIADVERRRSVAAQAARQDPTHERLEAWRRAAAEAAGELDLLRQFQALQAELAAIAPHTIAALRMLRRAAAPAAVAALGDRHH